MRQDLGQNTWVNCYCSLLSSVRVVSILSSGVFIARGKEDALVTKNLVPGESVYGEKRISVEVSQ